MTAKKQRGRILTTRTEMQRAAQAARAREKTATKIRAVRYDRGDDNVVVDLSTGATLAVPRLLIPGFAQAAPRALTDLTINPGGESVWSDAADDGALLEQLLEIAAGTDLLKVINGRISGRRRSAAKADASRANGAKGGRPPLTMRAFIDHLDRRLHDLIPSAPNADKSENSNPNTPASASWHVGRRELLYVKMHGGSEVHVRSEWGHKRITERRIRATADRLARAFARALKRATADGRGHKAS
jgi:Zinc carboxypeptidase